MKKYFGRIVPELKGPKIEGELMGIRYVTKYENIVVIIIYTRYLIRRNVRADKFSRTCSARKLEIFARIYFRARSYFEISKT